MTQRQSQVKVLSIKKFAEICHTTPRTLRFYEQKGLITPYQIDPYTKYRSYNARQARDFLKIKLLQNFNIPLEQIQQIVKKSNLDNELQKRIKQVKEELVQKQKEYKFLQSMSSFMIEEDLNKLFSKEWFGPYELFCMQVDNADYNKMADYQNTIIKEAKRLRLSPSKLQLIFYNTTAYEPKGTNVEVTLICNKKDAELLHDKLQRNFYFKRYPKTQALTYQYTGPYEYFSLIYQKLFDYIFEKDIVLVDRVFDIHSLQPLKKQSKYETSATIAFPINQD
ncbi:MAG: MerR family transcriptional regulator [Candidatus Levybacteria bacterium]|nr:MerR family transcriptional regulator [Candidatus Levybacteria bacterium]